MKKLITLLSIILLLFVLSNKAESSAGLPDMRISIVTTPNTTGNLTVNVLNTNGNPLSTSVAITKSGLVSDLGGSISVVITNSDWYNNGNPEYNKNYLVRVTFDATNPDTAPVVLKIERMEVMYANQGLYGAYISPSLISQTQDFQFRRIGILETAPDPSDSKDYTFFQGGNQEDTITYTLPNARPSSNGQVLTSTTDGGMSWTTLSTGGGALNIRTIINADYTVQDGDQVIISTTNTADRLITFPPAMTCPGRVIYLISRGTGAFIVKAPSLEPIFNHLDISDVIYGLFGKRGIFVSDGTNWYEVYGDFSSAA